MAHSINHPRVIIVGGGFGGLYAARTLGNQPVQVTLIDQRNFHLFQPLLYQVATGGLSPGDIASPLRAILKRYTNITVLQGKVLGVDISKQSIQVLPPGGLHPEQLDYDFLILATGVSHHYFGNEKWRRIAPGLKTIEDALEIRRRIFLAFEQAEWTGDPKIKEQFTTFVIVGGGPTGVELAGALAELTRFTLRNDFRNIQPWRSRIYLIEAGERILPAYPPALSTKAQKALERLGVEVMTQTMVTHVEEQGVTLRNQSGETVIPARTVLWAAGVKATAAGHWLAEQAGETLDKAGRVYVKPDLTLPKYSNIFVVGDLAHTRGKDGTPLPGTAPVAMQQGKYAANKILAIIAQKDLPAFHYRHKGSLAVIGRNQAVADFGTLQLSGFPAWVLWVFVHIAYLIEYDNKALVLFQWAVDYFTRKKGARLITGPQYPEQ